MCSWLTKISKNTRCCVTLNPHTHHYPFFFLHSVETRILHLLFRLALDCCLVEFSDQNYSVSFVKTLRLASNAQLGGGLVSCLLTNPKANIVEKPSAFINSLQTTVTFGFC